MSAIVLEHNPDRSDDQQGTLMPKHLFRSVELGLALDQHYSPASSSSQGTLPRPAAAVPVFGRRGKSFESDGDSAAGHTVGDAAPFAIMKADAKEENRLNGSTPRQGGVLSPPPPPRLPQLGPKIPFPPVLPFSNEDSEEDSPVPAPSATVTDGAIGRANLWRQMLNMDAGSVEEDDPRLASIVKENAHVLEQGVVLPCAPSEEEKVIYHETGRCFLVTLGVISVASLMTGLWLFTLAAPYFYWFGAPTAFVMGYLLLSYFGVAVWGKDFDPDDHTEQFSKAEEDRYYPSVDVFLPVCGEPTHLLDNTWKYVGALDYPNVTVHVLDDGAKEEVRVLAALHGFNYVRRTNRPELKKAGNLRYAFARTSSELISIFDADFCPRPEFLRETTPYFRDPKTAILQTPQFFRYRENQTWVEKGAGVTQELFYRMVQVNRNKFDSAICVGTCGVYRREALAVFGGTAAIGYSEDVHTGFNCITLGYRVKYIPQVLSMGTCPDEPRAFFMQQYRWCMGSTTLLCNREFWRSNLTGMQKLCYLSGMFYYSATAMSIFIGPLPGLLLTWFKPAAVLWFNVAFALPSIFFGFVAMRLWAKQPFDFSCQRVKIIQSYAHLYAIKDKLMNTAVPWIPTGGGAASRSSSKAYDSSVKLMLCVNLGYTLLTISCAAWRITQFPWYHFLPMIVLSILNLTLSIGTLL